jgi:hypothetical protein
LLMKYSVDLQYSTCYSLVGFAGRVVPIADRMESGSSHGMLASRPRLGLEGSADRGAPEKPGGKSCTRPPLLELLLDPWRA